MRRYSACINAELQHAFIRSAVLALSLLPCTISLFPIFSIRSVNYGSGRCICTRSPARFFFAPECAYLALGARSIRRGQIRRVQIRRGQFVAGPIRRGSNSPRVQIRRGSNSSRDQIRRVSGRWRQSIALLCVIL